MNKDEHRKLKQQKREAKALARSAQQDPISDIQNIDDFAAQYLDTLDCACVIHGDGYKWEYVEKLYSMLKRNSTRNIRLHVYTEASREVPDHMVKHVLEEWPGISGRRQSWWYKMQLFNPKHHAGPMLYLDLDMVIVRNIDWIVDLPTRYFWAIKDFRRLWRQHFKGLNSSIMWWDTRRFDYIWNEFNNKDIKIIRGRYQGDQDYITAHILERERRTFDPKYVMSWRWQALDGGYIFEKRHHREPGTGTKFDAETSFLVFHGNPKPHEVNDPEIIRYWA